MLAVKHSPTDDPADTDGAGRQRFRSYSVKGENGRKEIEIEISGPSVGVEIMGPPGMEEMTSQLQGMF
ncbi:MAG: hypothetical protein Ct9H300mP14_13870 [Gammaproteobacteria bacterium]|nr:MAG: hypothetical protein Ct9H300mP14_13870 [Gammaproteobacteria bacterium]